MGEAADKLNLPPDSRIHPVFQVSCFKKKGQGISPMTEPIAILQERVHQLRNRTITEVLVQWQGCALENATWENLHAFKQKFPHLADKVLLRGM